MRCNLPARLVAVEEQENLRYWGLAIIVNLGAAIVAALAFGAWQRFPPATKSAATSATREEAFTNWPTMSAIS